MLVVICKVVVTEGSTKTKFKLVRMSLVAVPRKNDVVKKLAVVVVMVMIKETGLLGRVVATKLTRVLVKVLVRSNGTVVITRVTASTKKVEIDVLKMIDCEVTVVKRVDVVVVKTKVEMRLVDGMRVVLTTVAMAKLVNTVWVLVKIL